MEEVRRNKFKRFNIPKITEQVADETEIQSVKFDLSKIADKKIPVDEERIYHQESEQHNKLNEQLTPKNDDIEILKAEIVRLNKRLDEVMELLEARSICPTKTRIDISSEQIKELKEKGLSNYQIAKQLGCSEGTIRNRLKE